MAGWLILIIASPFWLTIDRFLIGIVIMLLCLVYAWLIFTEFNFSGLAKFGSLDGVMELFTNKAIVTAGWVHYLAFDLLTGVWIKRNSVNYAIPHWVVLPCLLLTFMLGPVGLLLYLLIRWIKFKQYFAPNY
jgi:hypothetical protein